MRIPGDVLVSAGSFLVGFAMYQISEDKIWLFQMGFALGLAIASFLRFQ